MLWFLFYFSLWILVFFWFSIIFFSKPRTGDNSKESKRDDANSRFASSSLCIVHRDVIVVHRQIIVVNRFRLSAHHRCPSARHRRPSAPHPRPSAQWTMMTMILTLAHHHRPSARHGRPSARWTTMKMTLTLMRKSWRPRNSPTYPWRKMIQTLRPR